MATNLFLEMKVSLFAEHYLLASYIFSRVW